MDQGNAKKDLAGKITVEDVLMMEARSFKNFQIIQ